MVNQTLTEYLQFQGQGDAIGCLLVKQHENHGRIFIHHGHVVYSESSLGSGLYAFFSMLSWQAASVEWRPDEPAPKIAFEEPVDALLFQYAQLEDNHQTDDDSLRSLFKNNVQQELKLTDLKSYLVTFEVVNTDLSGLVFSLSKESTLVGRAADCDVVLPEPTVSSHHCNIVQESNCVRIVDLGSSNGTRINNVLSSNSLLQVGDELMFGQVLLRMSMKLMRHLSDEEIEESQKHRFGDMDLHKKIVTTRRIDPNLLQSKMTQTGSHQAITWKNLEDKSKQTKTNLLDRFFKKK